MVNFKIVKGDMIVVEGRFDGPEIIEDIWVPIRKSLARKCVAMTAYYKESTNETTFVFSIAVNAFDTSAVRYWLEKRLRNGRTVNHKVLQDRVGKKFADYITLSIIGRHVTLGIDRKKLADDSLAEATSRFMDELMDAYDGDTPEAMHKQSTLPPK